MNQTSVKFTMDTGSPVTIISEQIFYRIGANFKRSPIRHQITVANSSTAQIVGYADINLQIKFYEIRAEVIVVKDLNKDCLLGMELLETCPLTKEPIKQLRAVLEGKTAMYKSKQKKKLNRIQQQLTENTMARREWTRISETPTQDFFEGVEQQMDQKESELYAYVPSTSYRPKLKSTATN